MMPSKFILLSFLFAFFSLKSFSQSESDKTEIYNIFLNSFVSDMVVIQDSTIIAKDQVEGSEDYVFSNMPKLTKDGFKDFLEKNIQKTPLKIINQSEKELVLLTDSALNSAFGSSGDWYKYYKTFPKSKGLVRISNLGFSKDGTQAVMFYSYSQAALTGAGYMAIYTKKDNTWNFEDRVEVWIS